MHYARSIFETSYGPTLLHQLGEGPPLVVLHGGPGFSHDYLRPHLDFLADTHRLIYFDQLGSGSTSCPREQLTFAAIQHHASQTLRHIANQKPLRVIAHSWGAVIAASCINVDPSLELDVLLVNPLPATLSGFEQARAALFARMPVELLVAITQTDVGVLSQEQIERIFPFYISPKSTIAPDRLEFDMSIYRTVTASLGEYDFTAQMRAMRSAHALVGADDFTPHDLLADVTSTSTLSDCGHFAFLEQPQAFRAWALQTLRSFA